MTWTQVYDPVSNIFASAGVAFIPIICFLLCLLVFKLKAHISALITVILASALALFVYGMPANLIAASFTQGFINGMWPIAWIIIAAIFLYKLSVKSGSFEIIKQSVMSITPDHRIQVILIGFCFGSFLEGAIGFGGPVAITAALLVGLGLKPLQAAGLCLVTNTAPVAFGAVGIPIIAMTNLIGIEQHAVSAMTGRMLFPFSLTIPFLVVFLMDGIKGVKETFPAIFVAALTFMVSQFLSSNFLGAELPDIISAIVSLACTTAFLKLSGWQPKNIYRCDNSDPETHISNLSFGEILKAWMPFILLVIFVIIWTQGWFKAAFKFTAFTIPFESIFGGNIVSETGGKVGLNLGIPLIVNAGTAIFLTAIVSMFILKLKISEAVGCFSATLKEMAFPCITIGLVVSFAMISKNSGMGNTLGLAFAHTGDAFAFFSPIIGWLGVFLTGSDTSSNLLFGTLQQVTANELGVKEALFVAANSVGGVVGKMISPQSIAVACAAVGLVGKESDLLKFTLKWSVLLIIAIGVWTFIIANVFPGFIPDVVALKH